MNRVTLKNIKFNERMSEETNNFCADVYFDNKRIGLCRNDGCGGCTNIYHIDVKTKPNFKEMEDYCLSLPEIKYDDDFTMKSNLENVVDYLFDQWLKKYYIRKNSKKLYKHFDEGICVGNENQYVIRTFKSNNKKVPLSKVLQLPQGREMVKNLCIKIKNEGGNILNTNLPFEI